jgi:hypothetical protein
VVGAGAGDDAVTAGTGAGVDAEGDVVLVVEPDVERDVVLSDFFVAVFAVGRGVAPGAASEVAPLITIINASALLVASMRAVIETETFTRRAATSHRAERGIIARFAHRSSRGASFAHRPGSSMTRRGHHTRCVIDERAQRAD